MLYLMLFFERQRKTVDDRTKDLKKLSDAIVALRLVDKSEKDVVHSLSYEGSMNHELAIYAMQNCLQVVTFTRIFRIKKLKKANNKVLVDIFPSNLGIRVVRNNVTQEELVDNLNAEKLR